MSQMPEEGALYHDTDGRELVISEIDYGDQLGREIVGTVRSPNPQDGGRFGPPQQYACSLPIWREIWR